MKVITYMCENCLEPYEFTEEQSNNDYGFFCPKCGEKMMYFGTEEVDQNSGKVINRYDEKEKRENNPGRPIIAKPVITCPYCNSTNTKKISGFSKAGSVALFGVFAMGKVSKQWHCNNCGSDF